MFLLHFLPDGFLELVINIIILAGFIAIVVGSLAGLISRTFFKWGTGLHPYKFVLQIVGLVLLVAGSYFKGGYGVEEEWRAKVAALQAKVDAAAKQSQQANVQIQTKIVTKIKTIHDTKVVTKQVIQQVATEIDRECKVDANAITILNAAARGEKPKLNLTLPPLDVVPEGDKK